MATIVLVIHLLIAVAMVTVVLMQRSEGGALGIGGGGGGGSGGGFLTGRGTANLLTRTTAFLAAAFFATSITLSLLAQSPTNQGSILDNVPTQQNQPTSPPQLGPDGLAPLPTIPQGR